LCATPLAPIWSWILIGSELELAVPMTNFPDSAGDQLLAFGALLGRSGRIIESVICGTSMGSTLPTGCRIRIHPVSVSDYHAGQVVAFVYGGAIFAHRIVYRSRHGVLTRGDNRSLCDLPVPFDAVLGVVTEYLLDGDWRPLQNDLQFDCERKRRSRAAEMLLRRCLQIDIRLARRIARILVQLARWRRLAAESVRTR
jgi:hypothetical protein